MGYGIIFILASLVFGGYFYNYAEQTFCPVPIEYRIGELDERFGLGYEEAGAAIAAAAAVWEEATGRDLFIEDPEANFTVNFIYDDRQALSDSEAAERSRLENTQSANSAIQAEYDDLVITYHDLQERHESKVEKYEAAVSAYNEEVERYNAEGGAPPEVYEALEQEAERLSSVQQEITATAGDLNQLVNQINEVGERGNRLADAYNKGVDYFNDTFNAHREFTQGTYRNDGRVDIYTFADRDELVLVLAHELGHALSIDHVAGTKSIMYFMIGDQPATLALSESDVAAVTEVCQERSVWDTIKLGFITAF